MLFLKRKAFEKFSLKTEKYLSLVSENYFHLQYYYSLVFYARVNLP